MENSQGFLMFLPGHFCVPVAQGNAREVWAAREAKGKKGEYGMTWAARMPGPVVTKALQERLFLSTDDERFVLVVTKPGQAVCSDGKRTGERDSEREIWFGV
ncbi:uncharacterized protein GLRG_05862 [Colletotrichum graminicola M1.001]|uniref:Uncharacterized protein n=1 Tax=Colletotrichum graminicola (strain M1.001 / M2 / FGSC 10212) TaxID=645133 RepID=E3QIA3_COLGM|nr:uncharacterized protein GLRG_05862 [Colletotrichum graminicola M1.001]EFQ30718.1 hypothetical protein GLRG_05862 [Colletotrichum graminicola M1.001]